MYATYEDHVIFLIRQGITKEVIHPKDLEIALKLGYEWVSICTDQWKPEMKERSAQEIENERERIQNLAHTPIYIDVRTSNIRNDRDKLNMDVDRFVNINGNFDPKEYLLETTYLIERGYQNINVIQKMSKI